MNQYYVEYEVTGFDGIKSAGPYPYDEIQYQRDDIAGYEGVKNVRIITAEQRTLQE